MEIDCYKKAISRRGGGQQSLAQSQRMHTLSAVPPLAIRFSVDFMCSRSESRLSANFVEKHHVAGAESGVPN